MPGQFSIDVSPTELRRIETALRRVGEQLAEEGGKLGGLPGQAAGWRGAHAGALKQAMTLLASDLQAATPKLTRAAGAVARLRGDYEDAKDRTIPDLNRRWEQAVEAYEGAVTSADSAYDRAREAAPPQMWRAEQSDLARARSTAISDAADACGQAQRALQQEYDDLVEELRTATRRCGQALAGAVVSKVSDQAAATYAATGRLPDLSFVPWIAADYLRGRAPMADGGADLHAPYRLASVRAQLERQRALGTHPSEYADLLQDYWTGVAALRAGIDLGRWHPGEGVDANRATIEAVYEYYGSLYLDHPHLQWAGMANMIGPSFAGGFLDLDLFADLADAVGGPVGDVPGRFVPLLPPGLRDLSAVSQLSEAEIRYYERTLLSMQKQIFLDMAPQHEAYVGGGVPAIEEMQAAGNLDLETLGAWQEIDRGRSTDDPAAIAAGNEYLLRREQEDIIDKDYQRMYQHLPSGPAVTYLMGAVGKPSIPGAQTLGEFSPVAGSVETPGPERLGGYGVYVDNPAQFRASLSTNLPAGNIANFDTRWDLVSQDTLPAYQALLRDDPQRAREIIDSDVGSRIEEYRLANQWDETLGRLTDVDVEIEQ